MYNPLESVRNERGWSGAFTRQQAPNAMANGTRVVKATFESGDAHALGAKGTVLGSVAIPPLPGQPMHLFYFIEWDDRPRMAVGCTHLKIRAL